MGLVLTLLVFREEGVEGGKGVGGEWGEEREGDRWKGRGRRRERGKGRKRGVGG
jgi:hypothetical protein